MTGRGRGRGRGIPTAKTEDSKPGAVKVNSS